MCCIETQRFAAGDSGTRFGQRRAAAELTHFAGDTANRQHGDQLILTHCMPASDRHFARGDDEYRCMPFAQGIQRFARLESSRRRRRKMLRYRYLHRTECGE